MNEIHRPVGIEKTLGICRYPCAVANIAKHALRRCQYREVFIALLFTEKKPIRV